MLTENRRCQLILANYKLIQQLFWAGFPSSSHLVEHLLRILWLWPPRAECEDTAGTRLHGSNGRRKVEEESAGSPQWIVTDCLDGEDSEPGGDDGGELTGILQHLVVACHESRVSKLMKSDDKLAVIEICKPLIYTVKRQQVDVAHELMQTVKDGDGEVVIEWYVHLRRQLALEVYCFPNGVRRDVWVQRGHPVYVSEPVIQGSNSESRDPRVVQVRLP